MPQPNKYLNDDPSVFQTYACDVVVARSLTLRFRPRWYRVGPSDLQETSVRTSARHVSTSRQHVTSARHVSTSARHDSTLPESTLREHVARVWFLQSSCQRAGAREEKPQHVAVRLRRGQVKKLSFYHVVTRIADRNFVLGDAECEHFEAF